MEKKAVNDLANAYLLSKDERHLEEMYTILRRAWNISRQSDEYQSLFNEVFCLSVASFKGGDFVNLISFSFRNRKKNLWKKQRLRQRHEWYEPSLLGEDNDEAATSSNIFVSDFNLEDHVVNKMFKKKEADKRQLIDFLLESAKIQNDSTMTAIIEEFPRHKNLNALGKALGLRRNTVARKLSALSRHYDSQRFGDIRDYLAV
jgi:hypothetical protein